MAEALSSCRRLRILKVHLDLTTAPHPTKFSNHTRIKSEASAELAIHWECLTAAATSFARSLGSEVQFVYILVRQFQFNNYIPYQVVREGEVTVRRVKAGPPDILYVLY